MTTIPNNYISQLAAQNYQSSGIKQPQGGMNGGYGSQTINPFSPEVQRPEGPKVSTGAAAHAQELNEVSNIGFAKKAGFENGLGGTNHPVDANGRVCKTWVA